MKKDCFGISVGILGSDVHIHKFITVSEEQKCIILRLSDH